MPPFHFFCRPYIFLIFRKIILLDPIAILYNNRAGSGDGKRITERISYLLSQRNIPFCIFEQNWPWQYSGFSAVWLVGGDGTLNYFINHVQDPVPLLAIFRGGTGNDFANLLYGNKGPDEMVEIILRSVPRPVDAGICNGKYFINMAGIGFDGHALKSMQTIRWLGGTFGYYFAIIKTILQFREPEYSVVLDDCETITGKFLLLQIANSSTTGGGFKVSPKALIDDGKLDLMLCSPLDIVKRFRKLPLIRKGLHMKESYVSHRVVKRVLIRTDKIVPAQLDGEMILSDQFEFSIDPGYLNFLYEPQ